MRKLAVVIIAMLCLAGCTKERTMQGKYSCTLVGETLYVELLTGGGCKMYFNGGRESQGSFLVDGDEITVICYAYQGEVSSSRYRVYRFSDSGAIHGRDSFSVTAHEMMDDRDYYCSFTRCE